MKTYDIEIGFTVEAHDYDEAVDIAKEAKGVLTGNSSYKLRDVEARKIEEER